MLSRLEKNLNIYLFPISILKVIGCIILGPCNPNTSVRIILSEESDAGGWAGSSCPHQVIDARMPRLWFRLCARANFEDDLHVVIPAVSVDAPKIVIF